MNSIVPVIENVVKNVYRAREEAEGDECGTKEEDRLEVDQGMAEERRRQHEEVLHPLMGPHELDQVSRRRDPLQLFFQLEAWHGPTRP